MSFSSELKEELSKINNLANKEIVKIELLGYLISSNISVNDLNEIKFSTESDYNINRFAKLLENLNIMDYSIGVSGKTYYITFKTFDIEDIVQIVDNQILLKEVLEKEEQIKALIRGIYLGSGSVNNPENKYHLEISLVNIENAKYVNEKLLLFGISNKILVNKKQYTIYIKEGEEISKFLAFIGANKAVLKFEEIRVQREMNNKVNRLVNCETANLNKIVNAAVDQVNDIKLIQKLKKFDELPEYLKEIALLRLENQDASLKSLGEMLEKPIGKSGVSHRLQKIHEIAEELRR